MTPDLLPLQQNITLKRYFTTHNLDLEAVMDFTPHDLDLENRRLQHLVDFIEEYRRYGSQDVMEAVTGEYQFPPIFPGISPESDWYRFELWLRGEATQKPLAEMLVDQSAFRKSEEISDADIEKELHRLLEAIENANIGIGLCEGVPPRLLYAYLHEILDDTFLMSDGGWVIDGCTGYCPGCIQRPWCQSGQDTCFSEDVAAGKIHFTEELAPYISAEPHSLAPMQKIKAERDAAIEKIRKDQANRAPDEDGLSKMN